MFLVNLAFADLLVTGFAIPSVIAAVFQKGNIFTETSCQVVGFLVTVLCTVSLSNLFAIAANRYVAIVHHHQYPKVFSKTRIRLLVFATWFYAVLLTVPTVAGWSAVGYDRKMQVCTWSDEVSISYSIFAVFFAIFVPLCGLIVCYVKLYNTAREQGKWVRDISKTAGNMNQYQKSVQRDINLLKTLFITTVVFLVSWTPYGIMSIVFGPNSNPIADKVCGYLALTNSCMNFIIYGVTNPVYRQGYMAFLSRIVCCSGLKKRLIKSSENNSLGSTIRRRKGPLAAGNGLGNSNSMVPSIQETTRFTPVITRKHAEIESNLVAKAKE
uniref:5-hydroxytryptamine receptor-like n=1 Tax=Phallusia mammillata TaxID=59560 RepID=A0A6F9DFM4_9ASCI|nr:5-hydroxytryptamine receptor-like [Phallusia mammillata]